jgi:probable phosphoglycerate mutase
METLIYLVRHGETLWNHEQRLQGQSDSPLTETGIEQAIKLANHLSSLSFDAIYSSDLERAIHTTRIITSRNGKSNVFYDERIRERHFGAFQGLTWEEISEKYPEDAAKELSGSPMNVVPGGESKHHLLSRTSVFFNDVVQLHPGKKILVVSHGGVVNVWVRHVLHIPLDMPRRFHLGNSTVNIFEYSDNKWYLKTLGETPCKT